MGRFIPRCTGKPASNSLHGDINPILRKKLVCHRSLVIFNGALHSIPYGCHFVQLYIGFNLMWYKSHRQCRADTCGRLIVHQSMASWIHLRWRQRNMLVPTVWMHLAARYTNDYVILWRETWEWSNWHVRSGHVKAMLSDRSLYPHMGFWRSAFAKGWRLATLLIAEVEFGFVYECWHDSTVCFSGCACVPVMDGIIVSNLGWISSDRAVIVKVHLGKTLATTSLFHFIGLLCAAHKLKSLRLPRCSPAPSRRCGVCCPTKV